MLNIVKRTLQTSDGQSSGGVQTEVECGTEFQFRFAKGESTRTSLGVQYSPPKRKLFPGERIRFPASSWFLRVPAGTCLSVGAARLSSTVHLDTVLRSSEKPT